jgi:putative ABC transport system permease protein
LVRNLLRRKAVERDLDAEVNGYTQLLEEENVAQGMKPGDARRAARIELGGPEQVKEEVRGIRAGVWFETFWRDVRFGVRLLWKAPAFSAFAIAVLALGIGASTAIFSVADVVLIRPLPYRDPSRLVMVWEDASFVGFPHNTPAPGNFSDWKAQNHSFEDVAAIRDATYNITGEGDPEQLDAIKATANVFPLLGMSPELGRVFGADEDRAGGPRVVVLSHGLWARRFASDPTLIGRDIELNDAKYTVIGVMPAGFAFPDNDAELWMPAQFTSEQLAEHDSHYLRVVARLKPGISVAKANADLAAIALRLAQQYPDSNTSVGAYCVPLQKDAAGTFRTAVFILLGSVGLLLLISCANIANLLLARAAGRRRELAVRIALGAGRFRLTRQLLTESVLLSLAGGALGMLLAVWGSALLARMIPANFTYGGGLDFRVLGFAAGISVATGVLFGTLPALRVSRLDLNLALKESGGRGEVGSGNRTRHLLVISEVALALLLMLGATLMMRSFLNLRAIDPGFRADHILTMRTSLPQPKYKDLSRRIAFFDAVLERVRRLPGVVSAGYVSYLPLTMRGGADGFTVEGQPPRRPGEVNDANSRAVTPDFFRTLGVPLIAGRMIDTRDTSTSLLVAVINQAMAAAFWPGENPLGRRFKLDGYSHNVPWITIVGVTGNMRQMGLDVPARAEMCFPYTQAQYFSLRDLAIRTVGDPMRLAEEVRRQIWAVDPAQPVTRVRPLDALLDEELGPHRLQAEMLGIFAGMALLLASLGIYAVLAFTVSERTQEIGVRMALGAQKSDVLRLILGTGLKLVLVGLAAGMLAALILAPWLESSLYGVRAKDPASMIGVAAFLLGVAVLACWIPGRRAAAADPMVALRHE